MNSKEAFEDITKYLERTLFKKEFEAVEKDLDMIELLKKTLVIDTTTDEQKIYLSASPEDFKKVVAWLESK